MLCAFRTKIEEDGRNCGKRAGIHANSSGRYLDVELVAFWQTEKVSKVVVYLEQLATRCTLTENADVCRTDSARFWNALAACKLQLYIINSPSWTRFLLMALLWIRFSIGSWRWLPRHRRSRAHCRSGCSSPGPPIRRPHSIASCS